MNMQAAAPLIRGKFLRMHTSHVTHFYAVWNSY